MSQMSKNTILVGRTPKDKIKLYWVPDEHKKEMGKALQSFGVFYCITKEFIMTTPDGWSSLKQLLS
jgi:hypothetical protein